MELFVLTNHCKSKAHCGTCRNLNDGRNYREKLSKMFLLPDNNVDFECPYGEKWEGQTSVNTQSKTLPNIAPKLSNVNPTQPKPCLPCQRKKQGLPPTA